MDKYNDISYDPYRQLIVNLIKNNIDEEKIYLAGQENSKELETYLNSHSKAGYIKITIDEWNELCKIEIEEHKTTKEAKVVDGVIFSNKEVNNFRISRDRDSTWQRFKRISLKENNGFEDETTTNIENDVLRIIKNLSVETKKEEPVKGLVIGGVQSGKTTNIAALIAMASDMGFNVFIILSGMIESLRIQTEGRMRELLNVTGGKKVQWETIDNGKGSINKSIQSVYSENVRIITTVLKQTSRLKDLIKWLHMDKIISKKLKVLIIDDESDQAGVNTSDTPELERKTINRLIVNLVHGKDINGRDINTNIKAINYIGYTATPYANILSESPDSEGSLYPKKFISVLAKSNRHFGPLEIFGEMGSEQESIDIIRRIDKSIKVKDLSNELSFGIPKELKESIAYFIAASASLRKHNFGKPVSMLLQISHRIQDHNLINDKVLEWLTEKENEVISLTKDVWNRELDKLKIEDFNNKVYVNKEKTLIKHSYDEIIGTIKGILKTIEPIGKDSTMDKLIYHDGIHLIVDNSDVSRNKQDKENRLVYPTSALDNEKTPIFLIIGGDTLSRGLTLEGLITTYFLRTPSAADTLTQMGRWFGYRINYELYPRIWMTDKTRMQFEYISTLEKELRDEIEEMEKLGNAPDEVGPRIKHLPQYISVTSRNKSKAMVPAEYNFAGYSSQTYIFDNDYETQKNNLKLGEEFINSLGSPIIIEEGRRDNVYWENIPFEKIKNNLLKQFKFNDRIKAFNNIQILFDWIDKATSNKKLDNWNVIIAGVEKANKPTNNWKLDHFSYNMVNRTKKISSLESEINIGALRGPRDLFNDVDQSKLDEEQKNMLDIAIKSGKRMDYNNFRNSIGLGIVPQLILYKINKNSEPRNINDRQKLGIETDLFGIYISIPGGQKSSYTTYITVDIKDIPDVGLEENEVDE